MRVAINQPYFFPYLGYFSLIKQTEQFVLLDEVQFIKQGWIHRNRVLSEGGSWNYIRVPLEKYRQKDLISEVRINNKEEWRNEIFKHLLYYKKRAPYYQETIDTVEKALNIDTDSIVRLNEHSLRVICNYIGIPADFKIFTEMGLVVERSEAPDEVPLNICEALGNVTEYWNLEGGASFYDRSKFEKAGIAIKFLKSNLLEYPQIQGGFEKALSILDVMMFNEPKKIRDMLDDFILI